jgi:hypothetical protein
LTNNNKTLEYLIRRETVKSSASLCLISVDTKIVDFWVQHFVHHLSLCFYYVYVLSSKGMDWSQKYEF